MTGIFYKRSIGWGWGVLACMLVFFAYTISPNPSTKTIRKQYEIIIYLSGSMHIRLLSHVMLATAVKVKDGDVG